MKQIFLEHQILGITLRILGLVTLSSCAHRRFDTQPLSEGQKENVDPNQGAAPQTSSALMKKIARQFIADLQLYNDPFKHRFYEYGSLRQPDAEPIQKTYRPYQDEKREPLKVPTESEVYFFEGNSADFTSEASIEIFGEANGSSPLFDAPTRTFRLPVLKDDTMLFSAATRIFEQLPQVKKIAAQKVYMTSSIRTVLVIPEPETELPYYLKFDGNWVQPGRTIDAATIASAIEKAAFIKKQNNVVPESVAISAVVSKRLIREYGKQEIHAIYRPFQLAWDTEMKAEEGDFLVPFHAFFDVRFYKEHPIGMKILAAGRFKWQQEELAPAIANFLVSSLLDSASHFEIHGQNTDILLSSSGKIKRVYQKDLSDSLIDPELYVLLTGKPFKHTAALASLVGYAYQGFGELGAGVEVQAAPSPEFPSPNAKQFASYNLVIWYMHYLTNYLKRSENIFGTNEKSLSQKISAEVSKIWKTRFSDKAYYQGLGFSDSGGTFLANIFNHKAFDLELHKKIFELREFLVQALIMGRGLQHRNEITDKEIAARCLAKLQSRNAIVQVSESIYSDRFGHDPKYPNAAKSLTLAQAMKKAEEATGCTYKLRNMYNHIFGVCTTDPKKLPSSHFFLVDPPAESCILPAQ